MNTYTLGEYLIVSVWVHKITAQVRQVMTHFLSAVIWEAICMQSNPFIMGKNVPFHLGI